MKKIINLVLAATVAPLSSFSICASNSLSSNNENEPGDAYNIKVNIPPYFPCVVSTDATQLVQPKSEQDGAFHVYIEDDPTHEFYLEKIDISCEGLDPQAVSNYFTIDRWEGHNSAFEITVKWQFYKEVATDVEITPTVKRSSFNVVNDNPEHTKIVTQEAKLFNAYRTEIYPLNSRAKVAHEISVKVDGAELASDQYRWNVVDEGAYGILTIKANIMTCNNMSISVTTSDEPIESPKSLICRFNYGSTTISLGSIPNCIGQDKDKFRIDFTNICRSLPRFTWKATKVSKIAEDGQTEIPLDEAVFNFDNETREFDLDLTKYASDPKANMIVDFANLKSASTFANESWFDLNRWMTFAKNNSLNVMEFLKSIYNIGDFFGQEKTVRWDNVDHKVRIVAVNTTPLAANDHLVTSPSSQKAMFTFEFENVLTNSNGSLASHNWSNATAWYDPDWGCNCWCCGSNDSDMPQSGIYKYLHGSEFLDKLDPNLKPLLKYNANHRITYTNRERGELCPTAQFWIRSLFFIPTAVEVGGTKEQKGYFSEVKDGDHDDWADVNINKWYANHIATPTRGAVACRIKTIANSSTACNYWVCSPSISGSGEFNDEDSTFVKTDGSLDHTDMDNSQGVAPWFCI